MAPAQHTGSPPHGRVLVGFDGSDPAVRALDRAADEARSRNTALEILCGWPWGKHPLPDFGVPDKDGKLLYASARRLVDAAAERARARVPDLTVIPSLTTESAAHALLRCGRTASLTVVGTRGHGGFAGLLLGSVSLRMAAHCTTPLMVVRGGSTPEESRGTVLLGVKTDRDTAAVRFGYEEAARRGAGLRVLHAWQYPAAPLAPHGEQPRPSRLSWDEVEVLRKSAETIPRFAVGALGQEFPQVDVQAEAVWQNSGHALVEASEHADVIILAVHRRPRRFGLQVGPVTHAVLHHAHCPVVLVPVD